MASKTRRTALGIIFLVVVLTVCVILLAVVLTASSGPKGINHNLISVGLYIEYSLALRDPNYNQSNVRPLIEIQLFCTLYIRDCSINDELQLLVSSAT